MKVNNKTDITYLNLNLILGNSIYYLIGPSYLEELQKFKNKYFSKLNSKEFWEDKNNIENVLFIIDFKKFKRTTPSLLFEVFTTYLDYTDVVTLKKVFSFINMRPIQMEVLDFELSKNNCKSDLEYFDKSESISI